METKKINWNRRVNRPRLTKRVKALPRRAFTMEKRMITVAALIRIADEKELTLNNLHNIFTVLHFEESAIGKTRMKKALATMRRITRAAGLADWTK